MRSGLARGSALASPVAADPATRRPSPSAQDANRTVPLKVSNPHQAPRRTLPAGGFVSQIHTL
eukprot:1432504-Prymnesium_polylepis.1